MNVWYLAPLAIAVFLLSSSGCVATDEGIATTTVAVTATVETTTEKGETKPGPGSPTTSGGGGAPGAPGAPGSPGTPATPANPNPRATAATIVALIPAALRREFCLSYGLLGAVAYRDFKKGWGGDLVVAGVSARAIFNELVTRC